MTMDKIEILKKNGISSFKKKLTDNYDVKKVYDLSKNKDYDKLVVKNKLIKSSIKSAVLCLLVPNLINRSYDIVLTVRSKHLKKHPGQVSFPGGKKDNKDKSYMACAFREAKEEIGYIDKDNFFIGKLNKYITGSGFLIQPMVAVSKTNINFKLNSAEVSKILLFPMNHLLSDNKINKKFYSKVNQSLYYYEIDWEGSIVWGATAKILIDLFNLVKNI